MRREPAGDLGRWREDGTLDFLGRRDRQIKIRGLRIELGEIEACLLRHGAVHEAAVVSREDVPGDVRLVAYITQRDATNVEDLRHHLSRTLPDFMVPSAFVSLESMPLTASGKLNRAALPAPGSDAYLDREYQEPAGQTEITLAEIWQSLLRVERIGRNANFFELGGHSLLGMKLAARVHDRFGVRLPVMTVFQHPTIARMARVLDSSANPATGLELEARRDKPSRLPLSYQQLAHWNLYRLHERPSSRQMTSAMRLRGPLDLERLRASLTGLIRRHEALRSRVILRDGCPFLEIADPRDCDLQVADLSGLAPAAQEAETTRIIHGLFFGSIECGR